jgi:hypothetical protein
MINGTKVKLALLGAAVLAISAAGCSSGPPPGAPTKVSQVQGGQITAADRKAMMAAIAGQVAHAQTYGGAAAGAGNVASAKAPTKPGQ